MKLILCKHLIYRLKYIHSVYAYRMKSSSSLQWSSNEIRSTFLNYFKDRDHQYVHSSSVLPKKGEGSYFINAGMNQFKPIFLGTAELGSVFSKYKKVTNSQKCIRVGGKHNDLQQVGRDTYHHTFFEMLGTWSFGQYFKKEACEMALDLLTNVFKLPKERLYVTYFAGDESLGLSADQECHQIWKTLGFPEDRIIECSSSDNFWEMGDTGPCGICTEIHYDHIGERNAAELVNSGSPEVVELWNLVFIMYNRLADGSLKSLKMQHVDTGMGLERLCASLNGRLSNYDTDLFVPIFDKIYNSGACAKYEGKYGVEDRKGIDTAYRIVADHSRMAAVSIADGLYPGRNNLGSKLRKILHRSIYQLTHVLGTKVGTLSNVIPVVVDSLGDAFPEVKTRKKKIIEVVSQTEHNYQNWIHSAHNAFETFLEQHGKIQYLTGNQIWNIHMGKFGKPIPVDLIMDIAASRNIDLDIVGLQAKQAEHVERTKSRKHDKLLTDVQVNEMDSKCLPKTNDSFMYDYSCVFGEYIFPELDATVTALLQDGNFVTKVIVGKECAVVTDKTIFYSEAGGQNADSGHISGSGDSTMEINNVQKIGGYVLHLGQIQYGSISVGDKVKLKIDQRQRLNCMQNHTATHILQYALKRHLSVVEQAGSEVTSDRLEFSFRSRESITLNQLDTVNLFASKIVKDNCPVFTKELSLQVAQQVGDLVVLVNEIYPQNVRLVSIGTEADSLIGTPHTNTPEHSAELCCGTHVKNTGDIGNVVITQIQGVTQGTQKIIAVTGDVATRAYYEGEMLQNKLNTLLEWISNKEKKDKWLVEAEHLLNCSNDFSLIMPLQVRSLVKDKMEEISKYINPLRNQKNMAIYLETLTEAALKTVHGKLVEVEVTIKRISDIMKLLPKIYPNGPMIIYMKMKGKQDVALLLVPDVMSIMLSGESLKEQLSLRCPDFSGWKETQIHSEGVPSSCTAYTIQLEYKQRSVLSELVNDIYSEYTPVA